MSRAAFKLQQRRRDQERLLHEKQSYLRQHHNTERLLNWENRTNAQIKQREVCSLTEQMLKEDKEDLKKRQLDLKSLYGSEMDNWKTVLKDKLEVTQEQKLEQIRERAYALKAKREAERQEFVKECYQRQWRDACDDLRAMDSKATLDRLVQDRKIMVETKTAMMKQRKETNECTNDTLAFLQDRDDENIQRREFNLKTKQALDQQLKWKREKQAALLAQRKCEEEEQLRNLANLDEKSKKAHKDKIYKAKKEGDEMYQEMLKRSKLKEEHRKLENDHNMILLQHALEKEQYDITLEKAKKEEDKGAALEYVQCLRAQLKEDAKRIQQTNAIRDEASKAMFRKNDEKLAAEAEQRKKWIEEVQVSRQEQIRMKQREVERIRKEEAIEVQENRAYQIRQAEEERLRKEQAKADRIENMLANKAIIEKKKNDKVIEQQEKFLLNKHFQYAEKIHQQKFAMHKDTRR